MTTKAERKRFKLGRMFFFRRPASGTVHNIRLKLHDITRLFNSMDPAPLSERELNQNAEEFIVSWAHEFPPDSTLRLRINLEQWPSDDPGDLVRQAIHNHFAHRARIADMEFKRLLRQARLSLVIGLTFLACCLVLTQTLLAGRESTWANVLRESLTIAGWVAMWRPMQLYLYDWWPLLRRGRIFEKLSRMPVEMEKPKTIEQFPNASTHLEPLAPVGLPDAGGARALGG